LEFAVELDGSGLTTTGGVFNLWAGIGSVGGGVGGFGGRLCGEGSTVTGVVEFAVVGALATFVGDFVLRAFFH
jgi:hypothetical protein